VWPIILHTSSFDIPTYLVIIAITFCLSIFWVVKRAEHFDLAPNTVLDICLLIMISSFVGSRALHVLYEQPRFYFEHPDYILKIWYGGFVYYGGFILTLLTGAFYCRWRKLDFNTYADLFAPVFAAGYAVGRVGCLAAGCCYGRPTTLPWGITFPEGDEAPAHISLHPTQIYSTLWNGALCVVLLVCQRQKNFKLGSGRLFGLWLLFHGLGRVIIEQFRGDFRGAELFNLSISTWLSFIVISTGCVFLIRKGQNT
jgi:phosphatidylglycerol:prolipoprotein diacylglycerol transferase